MMQSHFSSYNDPEVIDLSDEQETSGTSNHFVAAANRRDTMIVDLTATGDEVMAYTPSQRFKGKSRGDLDTMLSMDLNDYPSRDKGKGKAKESSESTRLPGDEYDLSDDPPTPHWHVHLNRHALAGSSRRMTAVTIDLSDDESDGPSNLRNSHSSRRGRQSIIDLTVDSDNEAENGRELAGILSQNDEQAQLADAQLQESLRRAAQINVKQQQADEALARKLAKAEEKELGKVMKQVQEKAEGIVFRVAIDTATNLLEDGTPAHPDDLARFEPWKKLINGQGVNVKKFHWIVNYELEKRFEAARAILRPLMPDEEPQEIQLFHGTAAANIDSILSGGFRIGGVDGHGVAHGQALGFGVYLGRSPAISMGYAAGADRMFACRVLTGRTTNSLIHSQKPPAKEVGSGTYETYTNGTVYVVRHAALVLPCYMIEFENPQANAYGLMGGIGWGGALPMPVPMPMPMVMPPAGGAIWGGVMRRGAFPLLPLPLAPPPPPPRPRTRAGLAAAAAAAAAAAPPARRTNAIRQAKTTAAAKKATAVLDAAKRSRAKRGAQ